MIHLRAFLPPHLLRDLAERGGPPRGLRADRFEAALLFADLVGFTALTERLQSLGRDGAEEIATAVDRIFRPSIHAIEAVDGSVQSFGGDAIFATFRGGDAVPRAVAAARRIGRWVEDHGTLRTRAGTARLRISLVVHRGRVTALHLGEGPRRQYVVAGAPVQELARLHARAPRGRLVISPAAQRALPAGAVAPRLPALPAVPRDWLAAYVPPALLPALGRMDGDFREIAVLFLETRSREPRAMDAFFRRLTAVLEAHGGVLLKTDLSSSGTKWMCVFGIPRGHEDDLARAARAACEILSQLPRRAAVRGGLHGGTVVALHVGSGTRSSLDVLGDVVNTAARALARAAWGEVLVTRAAVSRIPGVKTVHRGRWRVAGKAAPLELHALRRVGSDGATASIPFVPVGRDATRRLIARALADARRGRARVVALEGDAGMGKSLLARDAARTAEGLGFRVVAGRAVPFGARELHPLSEVVRAVVARGDEAGAPALDRALRIMGIGSLEREVLGTLLDGAAPASATHLDGPTFRRTRIAAMGSVLARASARQPLLVVLEDMQHADAATWDAVRILGSRTAARRLAILVLGRTGAFPPGVKPTVLRKLPARALAAVLRARLGPLRAAATRELVRRADGNPYYVEEIARHLVASGALARAGSRYRLAGDARAVPESLHALMGARLDRLTREARLAAEWAAVIGQGINRDLLARCGGARGDAVGELLEAGILVEERPGRLAFSHALIRDAAYDRILGRRRARQHRRIAVLLERPTDAAPRGAHDALLAHHWERGSRPARARPHLRRAAEAAMSRFAFEDAARLLRRHLDLGGARTPPAVRIRTLLGVSLCFAGQIAPGRAELVRARRLASRRRDLRGEAEALRQLAMTDTYRGSPRSARAAVRRSLELSRRLGDPNLILAATVAMGSIEFMGQHPERALECFRRARALARRHGSPQEAAVLGNLGLTHHGLGQLREAERLIRASLARHRGAGHRRARGIWLGNLAVVLQDAGKVAQAARLLTRAIAIARGLGDRWTSAYFEGNLGMLELKRGDVLAGRALLRRSLGTLREVGDRHKEGIALVNLAQVEAHRGHVREAMDHASGALRMAREGRQAGLQALLAARLAMMELRRSRKAPGPGIARASIAALDRQRARREAAELRCEVAEIHLRAGQPALARGLLRRARAAFARLGDTGGEGVACLGQAEALLSLGQPAAALRDSTAAVALLRRAGPRCRLAQAHAVRGRALLALGRSGATELRRARAVVERLPDPAQHPDEQAAVAVLARSVAAGTSGH